MQFVRFFKTIFVCLIFSVISANAAIKTWDGGGADTNWTTAANWVGDVAAVANDDLVFPTSATAATINNNFFFFTTFRSITFQGGTYTVSGNPLNLTQGLTADAGTHVINTIIGLSGSQTISNGQTAFTTLAAVSIGSNTLTLDGNGNCGIGVISGSGQVKKTGVGGSLIATATNFSGSYTVDNGFFIIDTNTPNSTLTINANGAVGGTGTISNVAINAGTLSAGTIQSPTGILNTKNISFTNLGIAAFKIGGTTPGTDGHDQLNVTGTVALGSSQLAPIAWNGFVPAIGNSFLVINNDGTDAINGIFNNLPEGSRLAALGLAFKISYVAGTGNDVSLTRTSLSKFDFDGDGKSDISSFRPAGGVWSELLSGTSTTANQNFGLSTDKIVPADFDGDTRADIAVFRPSTGTWYHLRSSDNAFVATQFGANGDIPMPNDFDGDGRADTAVYRPSNGVWYQLRSLGNQFFAQQFGISTDKPQLGDFDGDGLGDVAVWRPSNGVWYVFQSQTQTVSYFNFGISTDVPTVGDFDGDGKTDYAVFRANAVGGNPDFYVWRSLDQSLQAVDWGIPNDIPVIADYDGDGKADFGVVRPTTQTWYLLRSTSGFSATNFGQSGDIPIPAAFN